LPQATFGLPQATFGLPQATFGLPQATFGLPQPPDIGHSQINTQKLYSNVYSSPITPGLNQSLPIKGPNFQNSLIKQLITKDSSNNSNQPSSSADYKQEYYDMYLAKKQLFIDKCKEEAINGNNSTNGNNTELSLDNPLISNRRWPAANYATIGDSVKIYNRVANPPLRFTQGTTTTTNLALALEKQSLSVEPVQNISIRGLHESVKAKYDFCDDIPDSTTAPFNITCLEQIFRKMGGQPNGTAYPNMNTIITYNSMGNIGNVKQYINKLADNMKSTDYITQKTAMIQLLGILPEMLITRAPYIQGVEVIWFQTVIGQGKPTHVLGILKRTIETSILEGLPLKPINGRDIIQTGFGISMIQMFDIRAPTNFTTKYRITTDGQFFIAVNQPANIVTSLFDSNYDQDGLLANLSAKEGRLTTYTSQKYSNYYVNTPNITKLLYSAPNTFHISIESPNFIPRHYSLTLEPHAPFLNFEVLPQGDIFDDTRNPGLFTNLITQSGLEFHNRPEERYNTPGKKGFIRLINKSSYLNLTNIAYQSWGTVTFAFRLQTMPVKDAIFSFWVHNRFCVLYLVPINGSTSQMRVKSNIGKNGVIYDNATSFNISIGTWYFMKVSLSNENTVFNIDCDSINNIIKNGKALPEATFGIKLINVEPITTPINNGLYVPNQYNCNIAIGGKASGINLTGPLQFDLAWIHFFDYIVSMDDVIKDCKAAWQFTQYPDSPNTYRTLS
jgi:hypothetical protein